VDVTASDRELGVPVTEFDQPLAFNPGQYRVRAWAAGRFSYVVDLELGAGQQHVVALPALEPLPASGGARAAALAPPLPAAAGSISGGGDGVPFAPDPVAPPAAREAQRSSRTLPIVLVGSGGALVALGVVSGQLSSSARAELRRECAAPDANGRRRCGSDQADDKRRLERYALAADVLWISGALLAGTGITLFVLERDAGQATEVAAGCFASGCGLSAAGSF
jgi:hypothetical protein